MIYCKTKILGLAIIVLFLFMIGLSSAADIRNAQTTFGVKGGIIGSADYYIGDFWYGSEMSYSFGGFLDYKLGPRILGGAYFDYSAVSDVYESNSSLIEIGGTLKAMVFTGNENLTFRPMVALGYGAVGEIDIYAASSHLMLKGGLEMVYTIPSGMSVLGEVLIGGSVDGGNDNFAMTFGPMVYVRGGLVF